MKKLTKLSLDELSLVLPILTEKEQSSYFGGGDGSISSPYTILEWAAISQTDQWHGGYVTIPGLSSPQYLTASQRASSYVGGDPVWDQGYNDGFVQGYVPGNTEGKGDDVAYWFKLFWYSALVRDPSSAPSLSYDPYLQNVVNGMYDGYYIGQEAQANNSN